MELPKPAKEKTVNELLEEYVNKKAWVKTAELELDELKVKIDEQIPDDDYAVEGVAVFKRKKGSVRKNFDKTKAMEYLTDEQVADCIKETEVKPSVVIMSWVNNEIRKQHTKGSQKSD